MQVTRPRPQGDIATLGCKFLAPTRSALDLSQFYMQGQSLLFKAVQWKALYQVINEHFSSLPDSQILVLGSGGPYS